MTNAKPSSCRSPFLGCFMLLAGAILLGGASGRAAKVPVMIRGGGDAVMRCAKGERLSVTVRKTDLNIYPGEDSITVQLSNCCHEVVQQGDIPDDGNVGKGPRSPEPQALTLTVPSTDGGTYRLRVRGRSDMMWGVETSCDKLVIEAPMHLNDGNQRGAVWFRPPDEAFTAKAQAFHTPGIQTVPLIDGAGQTVHVFDLKDTSTEFTVDVPAGRRRGLWHVEVDHLDVKLAVDGVTTWSSTPDAWFEVSGNTASLLPRAVARYVQPGDSATVTFRCYADEDAEPLTFVVRPAEGAAALADASVTVVNAAPVPGTSADYVVTVRLQARETAQPGAQGRFTLAALDRGEPVAGARIECRVGDSPVSRALTLPVVLQPHKHESYLFGYDPGYVANEVYFGPRNRPFIRTRWADLHWTSAVTLLDQEQWMSRSFLDEVAAAYPEGSRIDRGAGFVNCKVAFDGKGGIYTMLAMRLPEEGRSCALLYSPDEGRTWQVTDVGGTGYDIEHFSGHNALDRPPPVLIYDRRATHPTAKWGAYHNLLLYFPELRNGRVVMGTPVKLSEDCIGSCQHSGGPPSMVTRDGKTHVIWGDATEEKVPGVPTYVATVDHRARGAVSRQFVGYAPPPNDVHNVPAICADSKGFLHMVTGAHGDNFMYRRSNAPNTIEQGLTEAVKTLDRGYVDNNSDEDGRGRQTYCSLVCDDEDTLHIAFRQWRQGVDQVHGGANYAALTVQSKPVNQPWGPAKVMVVPPLSGYSIYYHKLTIDRRGGLWLSYSYYSGDKTYQGDFPERYNNAAILMSTNHGETWKLAETSDFQQRVRERP